MKLGAFSLSLSVKDLAVSRAFYEKLGFEKFHGEQENGWLIMKSPGCIIGLFQGMFKGNIMTFNPGWDENAQKLDEFTDIRLLQQQFKEAGIKLVSEADPKSDGPASFTLHDPDGNQLLFDQHV